MKLAVAAGLSLVLLVGVACGREPGVAQSAVSLPGARGVWISDGVSLAHPEAIVAGREFAHIHTDGSLHAPLPFERAIEAVDGGWAERHPLADQREGWEGLVMLYTPRSLEELDVVFQLIVESYGFVTGRDVTIEAELQTPP